MELITPKTIREYYAFSEELAKSRIKEERKREEEKGTVDREDMFHFLCTARDPDTGEFALTIQDLIADTNLLIVAGSDTTSSTICAVFFFITRHPRVYAKLAKEVRGNFRSAEEIGSGRDLMAKCEYLRAVIDETLRLSPAGPAELERTVLPGGTMIAGEFYPEGVTVGISNWSLGRNEDLWGDANTFRPERWIVSDHPDTLNTHEDVNRLKRSMHPFGKGPGSCLGKNMAMLQLCIIVARTLWRFDIRQTPGQTLGQGHPSLGWGRRNPNHYQVTDAYITLRQGPVIQYRKRKSAISL
jgi:cytochrome P450